MAELPPQHEDSGLVDNLRLEEGSIPAGTSAEEAARLRRIESGIIVRPGLFPSIVNYCVSNPFITIAGIGLIVLLGILSLRQLKLDALPDLSDNQVVVIADWMGRSPEVIDDQVAYPLSTLLAALPHIKDIRTMSSFGVCMVYIIFDDEVDIYWARTRVGERLALARDRLPAGVTPMMGPEGTGVGHVYWYLVENDSDPNTPAYDLAQLRSLQDWYIRYQLSTVPGVAEVASGGGFEREYHVDLDPLLLRKYMIMPDQVRTALEKSNSDVGARVLENSDLEFYVRSRGYLGSGRETTAGENSAGAALARGADAVMADLRQVVVTHDQGGTPVRLGMLGKVQLGSAQRRGVIDHDGTGEAVTGIIVMRYGENAKSVIDAVKEKLVEVRRGLPEGVVVTTAHDRSWLIEKSVETLTDSLVEEGLVVIAVILLFLLSVRPSLVVISTLPVAVLLGFIGMYLLDISSNIMSLGGVAIAVGVIVDDGIVMTENCHRHLAELWDRCRREGRRPSGAEVTLTIKRAAQQISKPAFVTTLIIICGFAPVFFLTGQEGKLFTPLAWTKSLVMIASALMAVTFVPVMMRLLMRTRMLPEENNPLNKVLNRIYEPPLRLALELRWLTIGLAVAALLLSWPVYRSLGSEFMPNLNEGELVYMPTTLPNVTATEAKRLTQLTDRIMMQHPMVANVVGKAGRADTATDPAPLSMIESFVQFREVLEHRPFPGWDAGPAGITAWLASRSWKELPAWSPEFEDKAIWIASEKKLYSGAGGSWREIDERYRDYDTSDIRNDLDGMIRVPGMTNGWTMPIINRIQMLATGVRTDLGIKIYGSDAEQLSQLALQAARIAENVRGIKDAFPEKLTGGRYLDVEIDREACARYGLNIGEVQSMLEMSIGGMAATTTVEGRERYRVQLRYAADFRDSPQAIGEMLVDTPHQGAIPLRTVAKVSYSSGPSMVAAENGLLRSVVFANVRDRDLVGTVEDLTQQLEKGLNLPPGYYFRIAGQWENIERARERLAILMPVVLLIVFIFLYFTFNDMTDTLVVLVSLPFAFIGGVWLIYLLDINISVAVWVGFIALYGTAVNTGVLMMVYLQEALDHRLVKGWLRPGDIYSATIEGAAKRLRPKLMTVSCSLVGLLPLMWAKGIGADVMKPVAAPLIGGMLSSTVMVLFVIPVLFFWVRSWQYRKLVRRPS
ncbi:efflux RND transporter permease subunit [bacterium]|nr:efflux RND transporter permease subunit [bacterium]